MVEMSEWSKRQIKERPIEAKITRKVVRALKAAGKPVVMVFDGEEEVPVGTETEVMDIVFNLDWARLYTEDGSWVFLVAGNEWDMLSDYTTNLEPIIDPVTDWIMENWD